MKKSAKKGMFKHLSEGMPMFSNFPCGVVAGKETGVCKHWHEDDFGTGLKEVCKKNSKTVTCCGDEGKCEE